MHEFSDTQHILEVALQHARNARARRITDLYLVLGEQSSISEDSVQFYWDSLSQGTPAEDARLHFRRAPCQWVCRGCGWRGVSEPDQAACPACGSARIRVQGRTECYLEALDAEPQEDAVGDGK